MTNRRDPTSASLRTQTLPQVDHYSHGSKNITSVRNIDHKSEEKK